MRDDSAEISTGKDQEVGWTERMRANQFRFIYKDAICSQILPIGDGYRSILSFFTNKD
jgi:hypothetical protein